MNLNERCSVRIFDGAANGHTLKGIIESYEDESDFLKVDCEGASTIFCFIAR